MKQMKWKIAHTCTANIGGTSTHASTEYHSSAKSKIFSANCPEYDKYV